MFKFSEENRIGQDIDFDKLIVNKSANITDIDSWFWENNGCEICLNDLFFEKLKSARGAFESCEHVGKIVLIGKADRTLDISYMFYNCLSLEKLMFLIDSDEYIMYDSFKNCVQLDHLVCYENFKSQFIKNNYLNLPKLKNTDYDLYAVTIDKYKFIESLIDKNFKIYSIDELDGISNSKKICYLHNKEKMKIEEIEGVYGTGKKFIIVFKKDNFDNIMNKIASYVKNTYEVSLNRVIDELQFGEDVAEKNKLSFDVLNEIFDLNKMSIMKMFIDMKNPILDYYKVSNMLKYYYVTKHLDEYEEETDCEIDNGLNEEYANCISLYKKKYKKKLALNKIENIVKKPITELQDFFSNLDWTIFDEDSNESFCECDINRKVYYILNYYKVLDEFKYYNVSMNEYYSYLVEYLQDDKVIEWANEYYDAILYRGDLKIAEYFDYLENDIEDFIELNKLKEHLHLYSNIKNKLINRYEPKTLKEILDISNSYEKLLEKRTIYEYKGRKYYSNHITLNALILLVEKRGWDNNLINEIFEIIINKNISAYEKNIYSYGRKCFCDEEGLKLYNKYIKNNTSLDEFAKELNFSYDLYSQLKNSGVRTFNELLLLNWQILANKTSLLADKNYNELVNLLFNYGIDIKFDNNSILLLGLPSIICGLLRESNIYNIMQLISIDKFKLADALCNNDDYFELLINRLLKFGIDLNENETISNNQFIYDEVIDLIPDKSLNIDITCSSKVNNPKIIIKRYDNTIEVNGIVLGDLIQFKVKGLSVVGDYKFDLYDNDKLFAKDLPLKLQKKGFRVKDNH